MMGNRKATLRRKSRETEVIVALDLDPVEACVEIHTGIGFLDHLLTALATHAGLGLSLVCRGDLEVDDHHCAEDCALALGEALSRALARGPAPKRFGSAYAPLDEALARAVIDLSGRPYCRADLAIRGERLGELAGENAGHFLASLASAAKLTLHVDVLAGENDHHRAEAAFKALALALKEACTLAVPTLAVPAAGSTKGAVLLEEIGEADWARLKAGLDA
jgi:imidazoleglycerol-phosphate dehydratase